jgi:hypothetical protein
MPSRCAEGLTRPHPPPWARRLRQLLRRSGVEYTIVRPGRLVDGAHRTAVCRVGQARKTPSWPRSWANFSLFGQMDMDLDMDLDPAFYSCTPGNAGEHLAVFWGRPNTLLAPDERKLHVRSAPADPPRSAFKCCRLRCCRRRCCRRRCTCCQPAAARGQWCVPQWLWPCPLRGGPRSPPAGAT